jgi:glucose/arabinose dehydrogenase
LAGLVLAQHPPESAQAPDKRFTKRTVTSGLDNPWEIALGPDRDVPDPGSPYRFLCMRIVRLTYDAKTQALSNSIPILTGLAAGNDHTGGRLKIGPDRKTYLPIGDKGHNQEGRQGLRLRTLGGCEFALP